MRRFCLAVLVLLVVPGSVIAQSSDWAQAPDQIEVFGGYTYISSDFSLVAPGGVSGWNAAVNFKALRHLGFVADISGFYPSTTSGELGGVASASTSGKSYTFLFGPQVSWQRGRFSPFAQFLIGASHVSPGTYAGTSYNVFQSNNALSTAGGGGLDYSVKRRIALRLQVDWLHTRFSPIGGGDPGANYNQNRNAARISTGVVFKF